MEKKLNILYIAPRFHPFKGGAEQNLLAFAKRMAKEGHIVTVFTTNIKFRHEELPKEEFYEGIKIVRHWALNEWLYAGFYPELLPALLLNKFDVIHTTGIGFLWREFCLISKKILSPKTKFITTPHGPFMALEDKEGFRVFARNTYTAVLRLFLPWLYNAVIAVNPKQHEWMTKLYGISKEKIHLIPNGIDETYLEKSAPEFSREDKVIMTYLNRMEWYKGIQDIITAISKVLELDEENKNKADYIPLPEFGFWAMGRQGGFTQQLKDMVERLNLENYVKFKFSPTDEERDEAYLKSQINILASKWEATGIVLIEAMAKGNALVTTTGNEAYDILIKEGENGFVYEYGDEEKLAQILYKLLTDFDLRQSMIKFNVDFAKNFTWDAVFPKYKELLEQVK